MIGPAQFRCPRPPRFTITRSSKASSTRSSRSRWTQWRLHDGSRTFGDHRGRRLPGGEMSHMSDVAATDHEDVIAHAQERIEELVAAGTPLYDTLEELGRIVEDATPSGMLASILILSDDGRHLLHGAGPSLPKAYNDAIHGIDVRLRER